jgi:hypothetical protein
MTETAIPYCNGMKRGKKGDLRVSGYPVLELEMTTVRRRTPSDSESIHADLNRYSRIGELYLKSRLLPSP